MPVHPREAANPQFHLPRCVLAGLPPVHEYLYILMCEAPKRGRARYVADLEGLGSVVASRPLADRPDDGVVVLFSTILDRETVGFAVGLARDRILVVNKSELLCQPGNTLHTGPVSAPLHDKAQKGQKRARMK